MDWRGGPSDPRGLKTSSPGEEEGGGKSFSVRDRNSLVSENAVSGQQ